MLSSADALVPGWTRLKHHIAEALAEAPPCYRVDDIGEMIVKGDLQWWPEGDSALISEVICFPLAKVVRVLGGGGNRTDLAALDQRIEAWARSIGAHRVEVATTRSGWGRALRDMRKSVSTFHRNL